MALIHADFVEETTLTEGTGTLTLAGATTGNRTFSAAIGDGNTCIYGIESASGQFESGIGTVGAGTLERTTLIASSTGSKLALGAGPHTVYITASGDGMAKAYSAIQPGAATHTLSGLLVGRSDSTVASIDAGWLYIEGVKYTQAAATTLSLTSGNELGGQSLAMNKLIYVYAYNNAGTLNYKWVLRADGANDPLFSDDYGYWYHPTFGEGYRVIGVLRTGVTVATLPDSIVSSAHGQNRAFMASSELIIDVTGDTPAQIALDAYVPKNGYSVIGYAGSARINSIGFAQANFQFLPLTVGGFGLYHVIAKGWAGATGQTLLFGQNTLLCNSTQTMSVFATNEDEKARFFYVGCEYSV
jgi:hypothetical protein